MRPIICALFLGSTLLAGCGEADQLIDCSNICDAYDDCLIGADRDDCFDRCEDLPDNVADRCDSCLDAASCLECGSDCAGLLRD